jgi:CheY-like chemotaxis protein
MAKMQAARHGVTLLVAASSQEVLSKATGELRPDAIVLSNDLKNPTTEELMKQLNTDPRLRGVQVVVLKGILESVGQLLKAFPKVPWNPRS